MDERISLFNGSKRIDSTDTVGGAISGEWFGFQVTNNGTISTLTGTDINGNAKNFITSMNISGKTLRAASEYFVAYGETITSIKYGPGTGCKMFNKV